MTTSQPTAGTKCLKRRIAPREPIPAAKPFGAVLAAVGILLLILVCCFTNLPYYWQENAPALWGLAAGTLLAGGLLLCYLRFTLRFILLTVAIVGLSATLAQTVSLFRAKATLYYKPAQPFATMLELGLIETLQEEGVISSFPSPLTIERKYTCWYMHFRPHADQRVAGLSVAVYNLEDAQGPPDRFQYVLPRVIVRYLEAVSERFGTAAARKVALRSAEVAPNEAMRDCFREQATNLGEAQ